MSRILSMNEHYIKNIEEDELFINLKKYCELFKEKISSNKEEKIKNSLSFLKNKAKTLGDIYNNSKYILFDEVNFNEEDLKLINEKSKKIISDFINKISNLENLSKEKLEAIMNALIKIHDTNFKGVGQALRIVLTGSKFGPGIYDIIISLGKEDVVKRLSKIGN